MEPDELTGEQRTELRARLHEIRAELALALERTTGSAQVVSLDEPIGRLSRMDAIQQQKMAEATQRQQALRRSQVEVALAALETGEYGVCKNCDEPIGFRRLAARPETPFCLRCQGSKERA
jgi:DnaK suppressor protein